LFALEGRRNGSATCARPVREPSNKEGKRTVFSVTETLNAEKPPILKDYLRRWEKDAGSYFGLGAEATLEQLAEVASKHLVIEIASTNVSGDSHGH